MGFNVQDWRGNKTYYFYGYEDYSEAIITINMYSSGMGLSQGIETFYPNFSLDGPPIKYKRYSGSNNSIGYAYNSVNNDNYIREYRFDNNRLVYWGSYLQTVSGNYIPHFILERIEQNGQGIKIHFFRFGETYDSFSYYNISRTQLLDIFLEKYVQLIGEINEMININRNFDENILALIKARTPRELAILRNCLYAMKGYRFTNPTWTEFFNKYLGGYKAQYSESEVTAMFTENEKWLLYLIIRYENRD
jgi:hypothetical protein